MAHRLGAEVFINAQVRVNQAKNSGMTHIRYQKTFHLTGGIGLMAYQKPAAGYNGNTARLVKITPVNSVFTQPLRPFTHVKAASPLAGGL